MLTDAQLSKKRMKKITNRRENKRLKAAWTVEARNLFKKGKELKNPKFIFWREKGYVPTKVAIKKIEA